MMQSPARCDCNPVTSSFLRFIPDRNHINTIMFQIAKTIVEQLAEVAKQGDDAKSRALRLQSRHQLFPQVYSRSESHQHHYVSDSKDDCGTACGSCKAR